MCTKKLAFLITIISPFLFIYTANADETCLSPYMAKITGHENFVYGWTLGAEGLGDSSDKLVTTDVRPDSKTYGMVIHTVSVSGRNEAHHGDFTDDRRYFWAGGLTPVKYSSSICIQTLQNHVLLKP